jgi:hypothetical protein
MKQNPHPREPHDFAVLGIGWLVLVLVALACSSCLGAVPREALCRVENRLARSENLGSGTLVDRTPDGREGLVLTCAHLFREGAGQIVVRFPNGASHGAKLVAIDHRADLAALAIANPRVAPAPVATSFRTNGPLQACGFGPDGQFRCATGAVVGRAESTGQTSLLISDAVRSGDSGGGVFDAEGRLVAVIWGEAEGVTYASHGVPFTGFLQRVLGPRTLPAGPCPGGVCPRPSPQTPQVPQWSPVPSAPAAEQPTLDCSGQLEQLRDQIARLQNEKQDRGNYVTADQLTQVEIESNARHAGLLAQIAAIAPTAGKLATGLLGISGPVGWGILAATTVGGWLAGRLLRRRQHRSDAGGRRSESFQAA